MSVLKKKVIFFDIFFNMYGGWRQTGLSQDQDPPLVGPDLGSSLFANLQKFCYVGILNERD